MCLACMRLKVQSPAPEKKTGYSGTQL
jgi:hypothetical protein